MVTDPVYADHERRISRLEAWTDDRLVTKEVVDIHMIAVRARLDELEESNKWLMRFAVGALVGVVGNGALLAVSLVAGK